MTAKLKTAVIGVGYLGKFHAHKYASLPQSQLMAVCDSNEAQANDIAETYQVPAMTDYRSLIGQVDAVSIATPTITHHDIALFFLQNGVHVLLEKPITATLEEANSLVDEANKQGLTLQIGHIERFNNVIKAAEPMLTNPRFIESTRLAPFKMRGSDVNVILDLMIHDIDIIQSIVKSPIATINANGSHILTPFIDIANARLEFENGCVANVTASRINLKMSRRLHIFQHDAFISLDLHHKKLSINRRSEEEIFPGVCDIERDKHSFAKDDPLMDQIDSFLWAVINGTPPIVSAEDGKEALKTAIEITKIVRARNELFPIYDDK